MDLGSEAAQKAHLWVPVPHMTLPSAHVPACFATADLADAFLWFPDSRPMTALGVAS